eukprot:TRINITY_DN27_c0_g1_i6.p2 TRINITY_DN27_c0_g1~~TRINITY_DN27_c0_g1_i6.p2  ORF type:complete len:78 (+),score=48.90 TRINITY_DN27_c0_g1_i6:64-297(+)
MPQQIKDIKGFLEKTRRTDASEIRIKKSKGGVTKFKVRCSKYLYTLAISEKEKAEKLRKSLPVGLTVVDVDGSAQKK